MALRILSGMLHIENTKSGSAEISFLPFSLTDAPADVSLLKTTIIGPPGRFTNPPASIVAAREFRILDFDQIQDFQINIDDSVSATRMRISWSGESASFAKEIPFLVVGEVRTGLFASLRRLFGAS